MNMSYESDQITPIIESKVFINRPESRFALGEIAINDSIIKGYENEYYGAAKLRANTYLAKGFISNDDLDDYGTELDHNDSRSVHFIMLEQTAVSSLARVVGNMRLVIKSKDNPTPLPLENYCPDVFSENPIPNGGIEVSRLIARHEDSNVQNSLKWPLFIAGQKFIEYNDLGPAYGLISKALTRLLRSQKVPIVPVADERYIKEINATKQPVAINLPVLKRLIDMVGDQGIDLSNAGFSYLDLSKTTEKKKVL
jgi:hypothetical protein